MMKIYRSLLWFASVLLILLSANDVLAQRVVTGKVQDAERNGIPGVNVIKRGTTLGTVTDGNGGFSIQANDDDVLVISFIGYQPQEIRVGSQTTITVTLKEDISTLGEVVVIGYGSQKKSDLTGAVGSVGEDKLRNSIVTNIDQALQGRIAGVQVTSNSGAPGGATSIRIRGSSSITGTNEPLYVIDGIQFQGEGSESSSFDWAGGANGQRRVNPLSTINPADIVSIDVLKDASATAIYGSRGANGVIIITTRRGKSGAAEITLNSYYGVQSLQKERKLKMMNLHDYADYRVQIASELDNVELNPRHLDKSLLGKGTDWQDEVFRSAAIQSHQLSVNGGSEKTQYAVSAGYFNQDGIVIGSNLDRYSVRINLDNQVNDWFKLGGSFAFNKTDEVITLNDGGDGVISQALVTPPDVPVKDIYGNYAGPSNSSAELGSNPVALALLRNNKLNRQRTMANIFGDVKLPVKGLTLRSEIGFDNSHSLNRAFLPTYKWGVIENSLSRLLQREENSFYWIVKNYLTYDVKVGSHGIVVMAGAEAQKSEWEGSSVTKFNLRTNNLPVLSQGDQDGSRIDGWKDASSLASYFGRINYSYADRYLVTFTLRSDGSSKFGPNNRWALFPSTSVAWRVINENFMPKTDVLSDLKIRFGIGEVGNQEIGNYAFGSALRTINTGFGTAYLNSRYQNVDLKWEATVQKNIGLDVSFLNGRIDITGELYHKTTDGLLLEVPVPEYLGGNGGPSSPYVNTGKIENKGLELALISKNVMTDKFSWTTNLNFTLNRNKVLELPNTISRGLYWYSEFQTASRTMALQPIGVFYGYETEGLFTSIDDIEKHAVQVPSASDGNMNYVHYRDGVWIGDVKFKDRNGDGVINTEDQTIIGNPNPKFQYSISNTFNFKGIDLSIDLYGVYGGDILNYNRIRIEGQVSPFNNQAASVANRARTERIDPAGTLFDPNNVRMVNPTTNIQRFSTNDVNRNNRMSDRLIEDGSYLRIQNITLGYTIPTNIAKLVHLQRARVYVSGQNVWMFTNYTGYDPEIGAFNQNSLQQNIDMGRYPQPRTITFGASLTF
jgi:TonB-linked SusC/RagA family outer membrane protein